MKITSIANTCKKLGVERTTLYRLAKTEGFPKKRHISARRVGYLEEELDAWLKTR